MKILLLEQSPELAVEVREALQQDGHQIVQIETSEQIWPLLDAGDALFVIADWDSSDLRSTQFISRARAAKSAAPVYILLLSTEPAHEDLGPSGADDMLHKPFSSQDLRQRVLVGERIVSLVGTLAQARDQLELTALFDGLTGLLNRPALERQATSEFERARRASIPVSVIALDVDNFKLINEAHGKAAGDEVLQFVGRSIREKSRPYDCIGHWIGAEFVIILPGVIGADAEKIAERIITGIRAVRIEVEKDRLIIVDISGGVASGSRVSAATEVETYIDQARQAMSRAKEAGGNQVYLAYV